MWWEEDKLFEQDIIIWVKHLLGTRLWTQDIISCEVCIIFFWKKISCENKTYCPEYFSLEEEILWEQYIIFWDHIFIL